MPLTQTWVQEKKRKENENMHLIDCVVKRELLGSYQKKIDSDLMFLHITYQVVCWQSPMGRGEGEARGSDPLQEGCGSYGLNHNNTVPLT